VELTQSLPGVWITLSDNVILANKKHQATGLAQYECTPKPLRITWRDRSQTTGETIVSLISMKL
jgi:hypothetical protein